MNNLEFENLLEKINLTSTQIEEIIFNYKLDFLNYRNYEVENKIKFPMFLECFYDNLLKNKTILNQDEFAMHYARLNLEWFKNQNFSNDILSGLKARIFRTYPSLIRDLHFCLSLKEKNQYENVLYNIKLDVSHGIDVLIKKENKLFGVNLYTDTKNACDFRINKYKRHSVLPNIFYIELPVNFHGSKKCGDFFLYGEREMNLLSKIIDKRLSESIMPCN